MSRRAPIELRAGTQQATSQHPRDAHGNRDKTSDKNAQPAKENLEPVTELNKPASACCLMTQASYPHTQHMQERLG